MKKRGIITGAVIGLVVALVITVSAFVISNRKMLLDNFSTWFFEGISLSDIDLSEGCYTIYGNYKFDLVNRKEDNYIVRANRPYYDNPELPEIIGRIYKYDSDYENFFGVSEYGYIHITDNGMMYINLNDKGKNIEKVEASDIIYLSSFEEFPQDVQEYLKYLDEKIFVKRGAYSIWNR